MPVEKLTQKQAVTKALAAGRVLPKDGIEFILKEFGMTMTNGAFSTLKSQITTAAGQSGKIPSAPKATSPKSPAIKSPPPASSNGTSHENPAELARQIKELVKRHGVEAVRDMANVFAD